MATVATLKTKHPEFGSVPDKRVQLFLDEAALRVSSEQWGTKYDLGHVKLACHLLRVAADQEAGVDGRIVASESVGSISVSYSVPSSFTDSALGTTHYGREFVQLRREIFSSRVL